MVGHRALVPLVFLAVVLSLSACIATFREGTFQPPTSWPIATAWSGQPSISLLVSTETYENGVPLGSISEERVGWGWGKLYREDSITKAYRDSGLFSEVKIGAVDTDLRAEIHVLVHSRESSIWRQLVHVLTMSLVPLHEQRELKITTTFKNRELQNLGRYEKAESSTFWYGIPMLFIAPFRLPDIVWNELFYDLNRSIIHQAYYEEAVI
jgi:hypothetical protein